MTLDYGAIVASTFANSLHMLGIIWGVIVTSPLAIWSLVAIVVMSVLSRLLPKPRRRRRSRAF